MSALYIGLYFVCWALLHILLASLRAKKLAGRLFGETARRWYRLGFVLTAIVTLIPLLLMIIRLPDTPLYTVAAPWRWVMVAAQLASLVLLGWTILSTDALEFLGIKQLRRPSWRSTLTTRGLYRYSRHPMYIASMLVMWLSPAMSVNLLTLYALISIYFIVGSYHEEQLLIDQFGPAYEDYRKKVPRFFPGLPFPP